MFPKPKRHEDRDLLNKAHTSRCVVCNKYGAVAHHVKTKGSGGPDKHWNLMPLDKRCHSEVHNIGLLKFADKYIQVKNWLLSNGWYFDENSRKWRGPNC